ncbi:MAG: DUF2231 domain-containing protein [Parvibaculaceae bacterium]
MSAVLERPSQRPLHPLHAFLLAGTVPLFLGVLLNDVAYWLSHEVQWKNFASWLIVGGLVFSGFALVRAVIGLLRSHQREGRQIAYVLILLAAFLLGFLNVLVHSMDAWASMPAALILSAIVAVFSIAATILGFSTISRGF